MSKSLKNFISIADYFSQAITSSPADDFRLFCLQYKYASALTYSSDRILEAATYRKKLESFFHLSYHLLHHHHSQQQQSSSSSSIVKEKGFSSHPQQNQKPTEASKTLLSHFSSIQNLITEALRTDFDTPSALNHLSTLIHHTSDYMKLITNPSLPASENSERNPPQQPIEPILVIYQYIRHLGGRVFGLQCCNQAPTPSFLQSDERSGEETALSGSSTQESLRLSLDYRSAMKEKILERMKQKKQSLKNRNHQNTTNPNHETGTTAMIQEEMQFLQQLLQESDQFRSRLKKELSIDVIDLPGGGSSWKKSS